MQLHGAYSVSLNNESYFAQLFCKYMKNGLFYADSYD